MRNRRPGRLFLYAWATLTTIWFTYLLFLDIAYQKFPAVLFGGIKVYIALGVLIAVFVILGAAFRRLVSRRNHIAVKTAR